MAIPLPTGASLTPPPLPKGASLTAPEQGNMYTQGAEDIVYDQASGMPLYTSSYGSAPTGTTETYQKGLTAAAALPVNIATGVAKNAGGVAQTLGKYFGVGGRSADEMVNAINQIESGTQAASGDTGGTISAIGSAVGQAAPWLATGGGVIPSFAKAVERGFVTGGASALATPEQVGLTHEQFADAKKKNIMLQSGLGVTMPFAGKLIGTGYNAVKGALEPFYETGKNQILGRALREFAGGEADTAISNLKNAPELVKGSIPTVGQAAGVPSLAALENSVMASSPQAKNLLAGTKAAQEQARVNALEGIATPTRVGKYADLRERLGEELYADALKPLNLGTLTPKMEKEIGGLISRPAIANAMEAAKTNAANKGLNIADPAGSMTGLHQTKMALDREIASVKGKLARDQAGSTSAELDALNSAKTDLLKFMEKVSPEYKTARETYARVSKPVEQLESIQGLAKSSVSELSDKVKAGQFMNNLAKLKDEGILSDAQLKRLTNIAEDIKRGTKAEAAGRGTGSDTAQKLAYNNMLNMSGIPNALRNWGPTQTIGNMLGRAADFGYGRQNKELQAKLAETMVNPAEAARLMEMAAPKVSVAGPTTQKAKQLAKMLMMQTTGQALQGE
jgi:hypothetical protein